MNPGKELIEHGPLSESQLGEHWRGIGRIRARRARARQRRRWLGGGVAMFGMLVLAWSLGRLGARPAQPQVAVEDPVEPGSKIDPPQQPTQTSGQPEFGPPTTPDSSALPPAELRLSDGIRVKMQPGSVLAHCEDSAEFCLQLLAGAGDFESRDDLTLEVQARSVRVVGRGALFSMKREVAGTADRVELRVESGFVDIGRGDEPPHELSAGESVTLDASSPPRPARRDPAAGSTTLEPLEPAGSESSRAAELWELSMEARRGGRSSEAARYYAELVASYPEDPNAGLAALQLARLRMDALEDVAGAVEPLEFVLDKGRESLQEDALARLVRAHARLGQLERCEQRRRQYLDSFPAGVHGKSVDRACDPG